MMHEPGRHKDSNASEGSEDSEMQEGRRRLGTVAGDVSPFHQASANGSMRASPIPNKPKKTPADFKTIRNIGEGAFGQVRLATDLETGHEVAIKVLDKKHIIKEKKVEWVEREKCILDKLRHPSIVTLFYTFQDRDSLYFVLEYCPGGELLSVIRKHSGLNVSCTKFYAAELVSALEYIHSMGVVHRDLKPENILVAADGHLKLIDFGTAKEIGTGRDARAKSFCGTAEYMSPELLQSKAGLTSDLWALGCVIYQMLSGRCPFKARAMMQMFNIINARDILYPEGFPRIGMELVESLIVLDPDRRLGAPAMGGYPSLRGHAFFQGVPWTALYAAPPPAFHAPDVPIVWPPPPPEELAPQEEPPEVTERRQAEEERKRKLEEQKKSQWSQFLIPNQELIVETGLIMKKKGLFSRKRMLFITDYPRIFYVDPEKMIQKGEIPWTGTITVEIKNSRSFFIHTPNRVYILEDINNTAQRWAEAINRLKAQVAARQQADGKPPAP